MIISLWLLPAHLLHAAPLDNDPNFPTPAILEDNVLFWVKIYTETPMRDGLIHDRDYPMVIFDRLSADGSSATVKNRKKAIADAIIKITSTPKSAWGDLEHSVFNQYVANADSSVIMGGHERIRFQQGQMERYKEGLYRSGYYIDTIRAIMKSYGVPERLSYLPHVESSFNTEAYSKVGAAGLWQFMRGTGKLYGMQIDYTIDERRDPIIATIAAAKYLSSSYRELGTWPLAITSYNHGVYGMKRAVNQTGSRDLGVIIQNYKSKSFQFASSNFYGCFLAASYIAANHTKYFPGVALAKPVTYTDFTIRHFVAADDFCRFMGLTETELMHLNPAVRPGVFSKHQQLPKDFVLHLPGTMPIDAIAARYKTIPDSLKKSAPPRPQYYRVNRGDNLYAIASRLGVNVAELAYENNISKMNRIRAGQVLRVPAKATGVTMVALAENAAAVPEPVKQLDTVQEVAAATQPQPPEQEKPTTSEATIEIALAEAEASIPPEEIAMAENIAPEKSPTAVKTPAASSSKQPPLPPLPAVQLSDSLKEIAFAPALSEPEKKDQGTKPHVGASFDVAIYNLDAILGPGGTTARITVTIDETIGHYADWLGIPTWKIRKLNDMGRSSNIVVNRTVLLPVDRADAIERFAAARLEYHMAIEEDFYAQYTVSGITPYKLKKGENLWDICNNSENPLPLWLLYKYNQQTDLGTLYAGSELWIPQVRELTSGEIESVQNGSTTVPSAVEPVRMKLQKSKLVP